jgi:hypothetical protein
MKREDVIRLAEQAGFEIEQPSDGHNVSGDNACLERFAALVAGAENEACAKVAKNPDNYDSTECGSDVANDIAAAIRARGNT